jgi:transcriptional regulator with XRE-family HTH domain
MDEQSPIATTLAHVGPRLRRIRTERGMSLSALAEATGISKSTLSRLETGQRRPSLELLLPIAQAHQVPLDELVGAPEVGDPRIHSKPQVRNGRTVVSLTPHPGPLHAWKSIIPAEQTRPELRTHEGYVWLYVLSGRLRLIVDDSDLILGPGEAAEFDTRLPHWLGSTGESPVEVLNLLGPQGERIHTRAKPRPPQGPAS